GDRPHSDPRLYYGVLVPAPARGLARRLGHCARAGDGIRLVSRHHCLRGGWFRGRRGAALGDPGGAPRQGTANPGLAAGGGARDCPCMSFTATTWETRSRCTICRARAAGCCTTTAPTRAWSWADEKSSWCTTRSTGTRWPAPGTGTWCAAVTPTRRASSASRP